MMVRWLFWTVLDAVSAKGMAFVVFVVLARVLTPEDFGVFALAQVFIGFAYVIIVPSFGGAVIQREQQDEDLRSTVFWTNMSISFFLFFTIEVSADLVARVFGMPSLAGVLRAMGVICPLMGLVSVHYALFRRNFRMAMFMIRTVIANLTGGAVGIVAAMNGAGIWSLVLYQVVQWSVIVLVMWVMSDWRPKLQFSASAFKETSRFGIRYMAGNFVQLLTSMIDVVLIGAFLDSRSVGYYSLAKQLILAINSIVLAPLSWMVMPVLSRMVKEPARFNETYVRVITGGYAVWLPVLASIGATAPLVVPLVFGDHWADSVPVLQAMCLVALSMALHDYTGMALSARGRTDVHMMLAATQLAVTVVGFIIAAQFSIQVVAWTWSGISMIMAPLHLYVMRRISGLDLRKIAGNCVRIVLAGLVMIAYISTINHLMAGPWVLVPEVIGGVVIYIGALEGLLRRYVTVNLKMVYDAMPRRGVVPASARPMPSADS